MTNRISKTSRNKAFGTIIVGVFLFSTVVSMFIFPTSKEVAAKPDPFIKVKDGYFTYLDKRGYNFQFACEINQILIIESQKSFLKNQIIVESNNSFGITEFIFDKLDSGDVKFSINHQGNLQRDYWFRIHIINNDLKLHKYKPILAWSSGYFDFVDIRGEETFVLDQNDKTDFLLSLRFNSVVDFFVDPMLSSDVILDPANVSYYDEYYVNGGIENESTLFWDTSNTTDWSQWYENTEQEFGVFSKSFLNNGDFDGLNPENIYDSSIDDDMRGWYSIAGNPETVEASGNVIYNTPNAISNTEFELNADDGEVPLLGEHLWETDYANANATLDYMNPSDGHFMKMTTYDGNYDGTWINQTLNYTVQTRYVSYFRYWGKQSISYNVTFFYDDATNQVLTYPALAGNVSAKWRYLNLTTMDLNKNIEAIKFDLVSDNQASVTWVDHIELVYNNFTTGIVEELLAHYRFNEGSGSTATDVSGNGYHGTYIRSPTWNDSFNTAANYSIYLNYSYIPMDLSNLTAVYRINEGSGININDTSGNNHNGTYIVDTGSANWESSFNYDANWSVNLELSDSQYITIPDHDDLTMTNGTDDFDTPFSIDFWVKHESLSVRQTYFYKGNDYMTSEEYGAYTMANGQIRFVLYDAPDNPFGYARVESAIGVMSTDEWTHLTFVYNGNKTKEGMAIFLNGTDISNNYVGSATYYGQENSIYPLTFGRNGLGSRYYLDGNIDEIHVWRRNLTSLEILGLYTYAPELAEKSTSHVSIPDTDDFSFGNSVIDFSFSLETWIKFTDITPGLEAIFGKLNTSTFSEWMLYRNENQLEMRLYDYSTGGYLGRKSVTTFDTTTWNYIVINYNGNGSSSGVSIWINNSLDSSTSVDSGSYTAMENTVVNLFIGSDSSFYDETRLWNRELLSLEINNHWLDNITIPVIENLDVGEFGNNSRFLQLNVNGSIAQDFYLNSTNIVDIQFDSRWAGFEGSPYHLLVTLVYSDQTNTTQKYEHYNNNYWFGNITYDMFGKEIFTNITVGKIATSLHFKNKNNLKDSHIDNVVLNYTFNMDSHAIDEFVWTSTGIYNSTLSVDSPYLAYSKNITDGDRYSGIFTNNSFLDLDINKTWIIEINLTFNPYSSYYGDYSFAGGMQFHFLDSSNNSLAYVDLIDNSTINTEHQIGGSLFYNTSVSGGSYIESHDYDSVNYNITYEKLRIKKDGNYIFVWYPDSSDFGGSWVVMGSTDTIFQIGNPVGLGIVFWRMNGSRAMDFPLRNNSNKVYFSNGDDYSEEFYNGTHWVNTPPSYSRYMHSVPFYITTYNFTYGDTTVANQSGNVIGEWYGFLVNGSNQAYYKLNYTITEPSELVNWVYHNHSFYYPVNYTLVNVTFGDGTFKTIIDGFEIENYNSTYKKVVFETTVNGTFDWNFLTPNAITYLNINPQWQVNGTLINHSLIQYQIRVANGSEGIMNYPVNISVKWSDETVLYLEQKSTGSNGWLNSSFDQNLAMLADHEFWVCVTGVNQSFMGYAVDYYLSYSDYTPPTITAIEYEESTDPKIPKPFNVWVEDEWTITQECTVEMQYSYISSGTLTESTMGSFQAGKFVISLAGQTADTTIWFKFIVSDNLSNSFETQVFQAIWEEPAVVAGDGDGGDGDGGAPPAGAPSRGGIGSEWLILLFAIGAVFAAVLIIGIYRRVTVRTRRVEEREVISVFGRTGQAKEKIKVEEKGG